MNERACQGRSATPRGAGYGAKAPYSKTWRMVGLLVSGWIALGALISSGTAQESLHTIVSNGPVPNRINLGVLSEGYTTAQLPQFLIDATNLVNNFLAEQPYHEYRRFFNAYAIAVASPQSGSDHPSQSYYRNTYFNSSYDTYGVSSFLTIPPNPFDTDYSHGQGKVDSLLQEFLPDCDLAMLLVNDPLYGGAGGSVLIASKSASSAEIVRHESGHSLAGLGDEYEDAYPGYPDVEEPNTTRETRRAFIKWGAWIETDTPVPTPATVAYAGAVGLFEGAHYHATGWFRPKLDCKMRTLDVPFCEVCRQALITAIYGRVSPLDAFLPATTNLTATSTQSLSFTVVPVQPLSHALSLQWYTNGVRATAATNAIFNVGAATLGVGQRTVQLVARDETAWVRNDPTNLLQAAVEWTVNVESLLRLQPVVEASLPQGSFSFLVLGSGTNRFVVQATRGFTNWQSLATNSLSEGRFTYSDTNAVGLEQRFYRTVTVTP